MRHELKHRINLRRIWCFPKGSGSCFPRQKRRAGGTYRVTSLYFDTPYDSALRGENRRGQPAGKIPAEVLRSGYLLSPAGKEVQNKRPVRQAQRPDDAGTGKGVASGSSEFLLDSDEPLFIELYSKIKGKGLRPKAIVRYDREAFLYAPGNVRITLDRISAPGLEMWTS